MVENIVSNVRVSVENVSPFELYLYMYSRSQEKKPKGKMMKSIAMIRFFIYVFLS
jgi:hypothetical protein